MTRRNTVTWAYRTSTGWFACPDPRVAVDALMGGYVVALLTWKELG